MVKIVVLPENTAESSKLKCKHGVRRMRFFGLMVIKRYLFVFSG